MHKIIIRLILASMCASVGIFSTQSQETKPSAPAAEERPVARERERERERPQAPGAYMRLNPVLAALDTNKDGVISAEEIANAPAALKKLDKNGDGKITEDEVRPARREGERGPAPGAANVAATVKRLMEFDKNGDGKLAKDELPERMQNLFERGDTNKDGFLSQEELTKLVEAQTPARDTGRTREGERRPGRCERD